VLAIPHVPVIRCVLIVGHRVGPPVAYVCT